MAYSSNYSKVKRWFSMGMWDEQRVYNAVATGWITKDEYKEIAGKDYE